MGILTMFGLVTAEEHAKAEKERDDAKSALATKKTEIELADATATRQADQLTAARNEATSLQTSLTAMTKERDEAVSNYSIMSGTVSERDAEIVRLKAEVDDLKPDAEAMRRRRANDANRVRPSRAKGPTAVAVAAPTKGKAVAPAAAKPALKAKAAAKKAVRK